MATGPRLWVGATVLFPRGRRITGLQPGCLGEVPDPTALGTPQPRTVSPLAWRQVLDTVTLQEELVNARPLADLPLDT